MTNCTTKKVQKTIKFSSCKKRKVLANFNGGAITSDGGVLLIREIDKKIGFTKKLAKIIPDKRHQAYITHDMVSLLRQRIYGLMLGYEDLNDHEALRKDAALQMALNRDTPLASSATLCRFENRQARHTIIAMHQLCCKRFIASYKRPPKKIVLDFDATDDLVHGNQEFKFYHGYYKNYCFLPLYVFCEDHLLVSYLRPSNIDGAKHTWAILALLVKFIRQSWPKVNIIFRGDSGFCRHQMFDWCEKHDVFYISGIASNNRLKKFVKNLESLAKDQFEQCQTKQRLFDDFCYAANSWTHKRRIIVKAEHTSQGKNTRFIVTNLLGDPKTLYDTIYCARGDMENRIKEQQLCLFADRTSCHQWYANQFRLMLSSMAYVLMTALRHMALKGTRLAKAYCSSIRLTLFKIGAVVICNTRSIKFLLSSAYPYQHLFLSIFKKLCPD